MEKKINRAERARLFMPFSALKGFEEALARKRKNSRRKKRTARRRSQHPKRNLPNPKTKYACNNKLLQ